MRPTSRYRPSGPSELSGPVIACLSPRASWGGLRRQPGPESCQPAALTTQQLVRRQRGGSTPHVCSEPAGRATARRSPRRPQPFGRCPTGSLPLGTADRATRHRGRPGRARRHRGRVGRRGGCARQRHGRARRRGGCAGRRGGRRWSAARSRSSRSSWARSRAAVRRPAGLAGHQRLLGLPGPRLSRPHPSVVNRQGRDPLPLGVLDHLLASSTTLRDDDLARFPSCWNAGLTPPVAASTPLACSIQTRLASARRSGPPRPHGWPARPRC